MRTRTTSFALALALALAAPVVALPAAAHAGCEDEEVDDGSPNFRVVERDGQRVYVIERVITVCGRVPRPSVVYVLQARNINYEWETLKQDFLPKVLSSVRRAPF
jgi:hypothetical protein